MTIQGFTVKELREYARIYKIQGRSKMSGALLLEACRRVWNAERTANERAVLDVGPIVPGSRLRYMTHPGCVIVATSEIDSIDGALFVYGEYVSMCKNCSPSNNVEYVNREARGEGMVPAYRFFLGSLEHAYTEQIGTERIEVGADGYGCPITEEVTAYCSSVEGTEQVEHRLGCWADSVGRDLYGWRALQGWTKVELAERQGRAMLALI